VTETNNSKPCKRPFLYEGNKSNFCVQKSGRFICVLDDGAGDGECELGNFKTKKNIIY
jgi:hypothetical protein